ncbi:hypothetical protein EDB80DRAFT_577401 [Ilyonectria destructans]|nr:hypothetical protein EDB80DRAFT_577401 [Ilyonectria destructans]
MALHAPTAAAVIVGEWLLLFIGAVMILARLYLRLKINRQTLALSDAFICLAWLAAAASASVDIYLKCIGVLRQDVDAFLRGYEGDRNTLQSALLYFWAGNFAFFTAFWCSKTTILAFYLQIFPPAFQTYRIIIWIVIAYAVMGYIVAMSLNLFLCWPLKRNWAVNRTACIAEIQISIAFRVGWALHFSSDIIIFALPFLILRRLRMERLVRFGVYCTFGVGAINITFCLTRFMIVEISTDISAKRVIPLTLLELWSGIDCNIGVIVACMPALRPYIRMIHAARPLSHRMPITRSRATRTQSLGVVARVNSNSIGSELVDGYVWEDVAPVVQVSPLEGRGDAMTEMHDLEEGR